MPKQGILHIYIYTCTLMIKIMICIIASVFNFNHVLLVFYPFLVLFPVPSLFPGFSCSRSRRCGNLQRFSWTQHVLRGFFKKNISFSEFQRERGDEVPVTKSVRTVFQRKCPEETSHVFLFERGLKIGLGGQLLRAPDPNRGSPRALFEATFCTN